MQWWFQSWAASHLYFYNELAAGPVVGSVISSVTNHVFSFWKVRARLRAPKCQPGDGTISRIFHHGWVPVYSSGQFLRLCHLLTGVRTTDLGGIYVYTYRLSSAPSPIFHADSAAVTFQVVATGTAVVTARVKKHPICARVGATRDEWQCMASHLPAVGSSRPTAAWQALHGSPSNQSKAPVTRKLTASTQAAVIISSSR